MLRRLHASILLGALCLPIAAATAQPAVSVEVVESGLYRAEVTGQVSDPNAVGGARTAIRNVTFYEKTSRVPAVAGTRFGFRFRLRGVGAGEVIELTKLTHFPPPGLTNPKTGRMQASNTSQLRVRGDATPVTGFNFGEAWEAAPGEWRIELWHAGQKVAEQRYLVTR